MFNSFRVFSILLNVNRYNSATKRAEPNWVRAPFHDRNHDISNTKAANSGFRTLSRLRSIGYDRRSFGAIFSSGIEIRSSCRSLCRSINHSSAVLRSSQFFPRLFNAFHAGIHFRDDSRFGED